MIVGSSLKKQSGESFPWSVDFAAVLATGETITSATFRAIREADKVDVTTDIKEGNPSVSGAVVSQMLKGGTHGQRYMLELAIQTSLAPPNKWEAERRLIVKDIPTP